MKEPEPTPTTFQRFAGFVKRIVSVPKSEAKRHDKRKGKRILKGR